jgi:hypothetical protein
MKCKSRLQRMSLPAPLVTTAEPAPPVETEMNPTELDRALADELERFTKARLGKSERVDPFHPTPEHIEALLTCPVQDVQFFDLDKIARVDPARAQARWQEVVQAAAHEFASGLHAARALEFMGGSAWRRACFLALRDLLRRDWQPRDQVEALLIDELAQYELIRRQWVGVLEMRAIDPRTISTLGRMLDDSDDLTVTRAAALRQTLQTLDHLQRLMHNSLRLLLRRRPGKAPIFVRRAEQINLTAGPQMNLHAAPTDPLVVPNPIPLPDRELQNDVARSS